jgi:hypothetical protein
MKKLTAAGIGVLLLAGVTAHASDNKVFIKVEKVDGNWKLIDMALQPQLWEKKGQELLVVDRYQGDNFYPNFAQTADWSFLGNYQYRQFSEEPYLSSSTTYSCAVRPDQSKYTPCTSALTHFINTDFFFLAGSSRWSYDKQNLQKVVDSACLTAALSACRSKNLAAAKDFSEAELTVKPEIVDESGYYDHSELLKVTKTYSNYDCFGGGVSGVKHNVSFDRASSTFDYDIDRTSVSLTQTDSPVLTPKIVVKNRISGNAAVNDTFSNKELALKINSLGIRNRKLILDYDLHNNCNDYIKITGISVYVNNNILSLSGDEIKDMPPLSKSANKNLAFDTADNLAQIVDDVNFKINKGNENSSKSIGVSVKYMVNNETKTMFVTRNYSLKRLLQP